VKVNSLLKFSLEIQFIFYQFQESKQQFVEENVKLMKESLSKFRKVEKHPRILTACNKTFLFTLENVCYFYII